MAFIKDGQIVSSRTKKQVTKKDKTISILRKSFYFIGPRDTGFPLYVGYVMEDMGDMIKVWLCNRKTKENRECEIKKSIITLDPKNDLYEERMYSGSTNA